MKRGPAWTDACYTALRGAVHRRDGLDVVALLGDEPLAEIAQLSGDGLRVALAQGVAGAAAAAQRCLQALRERGWTGDAELAGELAAVGDHDAPIPLRWTVPVDLEELGSHLDGHSGPYEQGVRLRLATGELWPDTDDLEALTGEPEPHDWQDPDAWLTVEPQGSRDGYRDMQAFVSTVADDSLAGRLHRALQGRGAFARFRDALPDAERSRWRVFSDERVRGRARAWLAHHGCRPA